MRLRAATGDAPTIATLLLGQMKLLSQSIRDTKVVADQPLEIGGNLAWALRRAAVRLVPSALVKPIAQAKSIVEVRFRA